MEADSLQGHARGFIQIEAAAQADATIRRRRVGGEDSKVEAHARRVLEEGAAAVAIAACGGLILTQGDILQVERTGDGRFRTDKEGAAKAVAGSSRRTTRRRRRCP